jgi:hypothetical protein
VQVAKVSDLTLEQWISEYNQLKKVNKEIMKSDQPQAARRARHAKK